MKRLFPFFILSVFSLGLHAQDQIDLLRYSQTFPGGTARSVAMGGAFGALGSDFASATLNPAGMGFYRKSELTYTPEFYITDVNANYNGTKTSDNRVNFNANNFGFVTAFEMETGDWKWATFSVGYNKIRNFSNNSLIRGDNAVGSLADVFAESANLGYGDGPVEPSELLPFTEGLFYNGYLIDQYTDGFYYIHDSLALGGPIEQGNTIQQRGKMNEWVFSLAFNYDHWLYLGATLSIIPMWYDETSVYTENSIRSGFQHFRFTETRDVKGTGYSAIFGAIIKPIHPLRIGLAYHLPTTYDMEEQYDAKLTSHYVTGGNIYPVDEFGYDIDFGESFYRVVTPGKAVGSLGLILGKHILLSSDVEYIDYSKARLRRSPESGDDYNYTFENSLTDSIYRATYNIKSGVEVRIDKFYLRGGFGYFGSPYADEQPDVNAYQLSYSGGFGIRNKDRFIDFAFSNRYYSEQYVLYQSLYTPASVANMDYNALKLMVTFGFKF